ncbi:MAG: hypothetical protein ACK48X_14515 [Planctomycetota bacterium]|jgi:hypothetical protein
MFNIIKWLSLATLGIVSMVLFAYPEVIFVGLLFLIIPGLIMIVTPTVFVYLLATFSIRIFLPLRSEVLSHVIAFVIALGLSAAVMHGYRVEEQRQFDQAVLPEIEPLQKLSLAGDILLKWPQKVYGRENEVICDFLCTALLDIPGVTSVTKMCEAGAATFRLGPGNPGKPVAPEAPEKLMMTFWQLDKKLNQQQGDPPKLEDRGLKAAWGLRFARGDELKQDQPMGPESAEWTIEFVEQSEKGLPCIYRLEIRDKDGKVMARKSRVTHKVPAPLFYFGFNLGGVREPSEFNLGGSIVSNQPRNFYLDEEVELLHFVNIARPKVPKDIGKQIEKMVVEVLDNDRATEAQLKVVPMWLGQLKHDEKGVHTELFARILLDERIADPWKPLSSVIKDDTDLTPLRAGLAKRYLRAEDWESECWYIKKLKSLPAGTFKEPTDDELAIFRDAQLNFRASIFLERMADRGPSVIPELLSLLEASEQHPFGLRSNLWEGIRNAFRRLGREASPAAPKILSMIRNKRRDYLYGWDNEVGWLVTLRLIGVDDEDLDPEYSQNSAEDAARVRKAVEAEVEDYLRDKKGRR